MLKEIIKKAPQTPGVYIFKNAKGETLYVGKAANLRRRVSSYFTSPHDYRIQKLVSEIKKIDFKKSDSALEALILEARLIKKHEPPYNIREKDDKSFLYVEITNEKFPRVLLIRGQSLDVRRPEIAKMVFGPFVAASQIREALRILRRIFPWNTHPMEKIGNFKRPCFEYEIGLCPGTCIDAVNEKEYRKTIAHLKLIFQGKKKKLIKNLEKEMRRASKAFEFEHALKIRKQIFALQHIQDTALISASEIENWKLKIKNSAFAHRQKRIEGYDVSNISGTSATGAMVVFENSKPNKNEYRKFKIRTIEKPDDIAMLREVLSRRLKHQEWPLPDLILIDGGRGQVNAAEQVLEESGLRIQVIGIAKGIKRKKNEFIGKIPTWTDEKTLIKVRNESHRFARSYHRYLREYQYFRYRKSKD